tara:strand:+ start:1317 stop:1802 length:486 start_codon:yes stop_codon:yes gene_type:complete
MRDHGISLSNVPITDKMSKRYRRVKDPEIESKSLLVGSLDIKDTVKRIFPELLMKDYEEFYKNVISLSKQRNIKDISILFDNFSQKKYVKSIFDYDKNDRGYEDSVVFYYDTFINDLKLISDQKYLTEDIYEKINDSIENILNYFEIIIPIIYFKIVAVKK